MDLSEFGTGGGTGGSAASSAQSNVAFGNASGSGSSWMLPAFAILGAVIVIVILIKD